jgi:hypothetical protein
MPGRLIIQASQQKQQSKPTREIEGSIVQSFKRTRFLMRFLISYKDLRGKERVIQHRGKNIYTSRSTFNKKMRTMPASDSLSILYYYLFSDLRKI